MEGDDEPSKVGPFQSSCPQRDEGLVVQASQTKTLPTKWVFLYKEDSDGYVTKFKARLCARGDLQLGVNKDDVSAIMGAYRTFRLLMALVAAFDLDVIQLDAVNAFINADIDQDVYISCPDGYKEGGKDICLKLRKALYGLRKSPKLWHIKFSTTLRKCYGLAPYSGTGCLNNGALFIFSPVHSSFLFFSST